MNLQGWSLCCRPCHLDRLRWSEATEREWRDPENASSATLIRGVLPKSRVVCCATPPRPKPNTRAGATDFTIASTTFRVGVRKRAPGDSFRVELPESARRAHPLDLSTPPQSLRSFVVG